MTDSIDAIHQYWFGELDEYGMAAKSRNQLWFQSTPADDARCGDLFGELVEEALAGGLSDWETSDRGVIALILLLDQFTRTLFRGEARAFSGDARAFALAQHQIAHGHHARMPAVHQVFLFLPLEHAENLDAQEECVELFAELEAVTGLEAIAGYSRFAVAHREVIARFGRFPHRNAALGRESTPAEIDHLKTHGGF
ncbi:DUF924 domain-containing protein [Halioglobus maricola]|uniref:DUF924 domain-containing protein n=1 Tax=Halioglobus maricola TaxID=2601894 RepID=A0A5P9NG75_9GAMM|nr:DUF924 family protein [Halioglobus maricola]QFU74555.1 DUF924 domain-containing protein [Halioglobus maricola]